MKEKRKSYSANLKLEAINYAKKTNNHAAAQKFNVDYTQVSRWRKKEEAIKNARKTSHRVGSGSLSLYPLAEELLKEWIMNCCLRGIAVISKDAKCRMTSLLTQEFRLLYPDAVHNFKASDRWLDRFMNRFDFSLRRRTKTSQKLPKDLDEKVTAFHEFINNLQIIIKSFKKCGLSNALDDDEIEYDIVLEDGNKENKEIIATAKTHNAEVTERNHLIGINERELHEFYFYVAEAKIMLMIFKFENVTNAKYCLLCINNYYPCIC
ncbi:12156_t:CDS:2 [Racocetra fulgida]|uniref:12156_t:CDS:1 n=1 Tax=Racocetra fulgida TaxID=60492 RepID=A0A9N9BMI7_9GLOM|nr:12156_t:CDS:2 [Racocetra fulgida]